MNNKVFPDRGYETNHVIKNILQKYTFGDNYECC